MAQREELVRCLLAAVGETSMPCFVMMQERERDRQRQRETGTYGDIEREKE
jgi:hypothetical protein